MELSKKQLAYLAVPVVGAVLIGGIYIRNFALASAGHDGDEPEPTGAVVEQPVSVGVETVADTSVSGLNASSYSWPGSFICDRCSSTSIA